jgi:hypothetical protein
VVIGAAYAVVAGATMEYDGMTTEEVASGIKAGSNGATSTSASAAAAGAGDGADIFFLVALFFFLAPPAAAPMQTQHRAIRRTQTMIGK